MDDYYKITAKILDLSRKALIRGEKLKELQLKKEEIDAIADYLNWPRNPEWFIFYGIKITQNQ